MNSSALTPTIDDIQRSNVPFMLSMALLFMVLFLVSLNTGNMTIDIQQAVLKLYSDSQGVASSIEQTLAAYTLFELRLPRILMASCVGAMLAIAGCTMQAVARNPLADPGLIGISGGAAAAAAAAILFLPLLDIPFIPYSLVLAACGFVGALLAVWLVINIAKSQTGINLANLILAGVAINALATTVIGLSSYVADDDALRQITYWTLGSLGGSDWPKTVTVLIGTLLCGGFFLSIHTPLNLLSLGESEAFAMGLNVKRYRTLSLWVVALGVALATAMCGVVGFVGLVVPHIARKLVGANHQRLLPSCALMGASLMLFADLISRSIAPPLEIPIGIVTSAIGAPYLLYLLKKRQQNTPYA